jgi:hypothetical protein
VGYRHYKNFKIGDRFYLTFDENIYEILELNKDSCLVSNTKTKETEVIKHSKLMYAADFLKRNINKELDR